MRGKGCTLAFMDECAQRIALEQVDAMLSKIVAVMVSEQREQVECARDHTSMLIENAVRERSYVREQLAALPPAQTSAARASNDG